jgi:hypothetical protein
MSAARLGGGMFRIKFNAAWRAATIGSVRRDRRKADSAGVDLVIETDDGFR